ncbi:MAG: host-nuclease inhibitor Gam family protein [Sphingomonadales bacterium]
MPAKRHRKPAIDVPETVETARKLIARLGEVTRRKGELNDMIERSVQDFRERLECPLRPDILALTSEAEAIGRRLEAFLIANRADLLKGKAKSVKWPEGQIGFRTGQLTALFDKADEPLIIERLEAAALTDCIAVIRRIDKKTLARNYDRIPEGTPVRVGRTERFFAAPTAHDGADEEVNETGDTHA